MDIKQKAAMFGEAILNVYRDEDDWEYFDKLELTEEGLTEDFTAALIALQFLYIKITGDKQDLIGFTHILNRLAVQHCIPAVE